MSTIEATKQMTNEEYHLHHAVGHSSLDDFRRSRKQFYAKHIARTLQREQTPAMQLGSLVHTLVLEPETVPERYAIAMEMDRRTNDGKAAWAAFQDAAVGREVIDFKLYKHAELIANAVLTNDTAAGLFTADGPIEQPCFWDQDRIACKCKPDKWLLDDGIIIDLKTCRDSTPDGFARAAANLGYFRQAAWYLRGTKATDFIFVAVQTEEPYEVGIYEIDAGDLEIGDRQNLDALCALKKCIDTGNWSSPHETSVQTLKLPNWIQYQDQYQTF